MSWEFGCVVARERARLYIVLPVCEWARKCKYVEDCLVVKKVIVNFRRKTYQPHRLELN